MVRSLAEAGFSASRIAVEIGDVTRNAVVGVGHRNSITFHGGCGGGPNRVSANPDNAGKRMFTPKRSYRNAPVVALIQPVIETEIAPRRKVTIMELTDATCRWPLGDTHDPDFGYCGATPHPDYPYCPHHCRTSYESPQERERARTQQGRPGNGGLVRNSVRYGSVVRGGI